MTASVAASVRVNGAWVAWSAARARPRVYDHRPRTPERIRSPCASSSASEQPGRSGPVVATRHFRSVSLRRLAPGSIEDLDRHRPQAGPGMTVEARARCPRGLPGRSPRNRRPALACRPRERRRRALLPDRLQVGVRPRNPEDPALYEARVSINGGDGPSRWERRLRIGFRCLHRGRRPAANGSPLRLNGVNRHEVRRRGPRLSEEARRPGAWRSPWALTRSALSHDPPHPRLRSWADEIGLWVMLEDETHGFEGSGEAAQ